ncbi:Short-chain dehydrogenase/reductase SDR [Desulfatibacillum aliphaticivorans]|uniref:3-dehydrosphinganine reductase n=1 Tax=Desulfatibacillum aliphaticivorans TaxID=218208 RepID=B8FG55_DESAL|nr:SDR family oxidoreductase [Desulfatibacillum aliphaticivorans]ACL03735.1 Short-chain dehydrogenase/reductase SDR [Desulfatibacillum aliphaticivorans]
MEELAAKKVFITGGSSGIGLCTAESLARKGASVCLFARNADKLKEAADHVGSLCREGCKAAFYSVDVSDNARVREVMDKAAVEFGVPDILINCAGRAKPRVFEEVSYEQFDETMKINLYGARNVIAAVLPYMRGRGGHIVNTASVAGLIGVFGYTDYCASKFGIIGFSEALRSELDGQGIGVSVLCPPDTDTPGLAEENLTKPLETLAISESACVLSADKVAQALINGVKKKKFLIIPGSDGKMSWLAKRLAPGLVDWIMKRTIKKARKGKQP